MKATIQYSDELVQGIEAALTHVSAIPGITERLTTALESARQIRDHLTEADERALIDRPFLWVRRVTNATAASMATTSALVVAQNHCPAESLSARVQLKDLEVHSRELNARILAEPRPVVPGTPVVTDGRPAVAQTRPVSETVAPHVSPSVPALRITSSVVTDDALEELADDRVPSPVRPSNGYVPATQSGQALRVATSAAPEPSEPPKLVLAEWTEPEADELEPLVSAAPMHSVEAVVPHVLPQAPRKAWYKLAPPKPRTLASLTVVFLTLVFIGALAYPYLRAAVNKQLGDRLGARVMKLNDQITAQNRSLAEIDKQIDGLKLQYIEAKDRAKTLESYLTPAQRVSSDLEDIRLEIASITATDAQIRRSLDATPDEKHDRNWKSNLAMLSADSQKLDALDAQQRALQARLDKLAAPPAVAAGVSEANQKVSDLESQIRARSVDRDLLATSIASNEQYADQLRAQRERAYHPQ